MDLFFIKIFPKSNCYCINIAFWFEPLLLYTQLTNFIKKAAANMWLPQNEKQCFIPIQPVHDSQ